MNLSARSSAESTEMAGYPILGQYGTASELTVILLPRRNGSSRALAPATRERVLLEHLPMVRTIARSIRARLPQHVDLDDLVSAGTLGLLDALGKFDLARQVQFRSYAQFRVRGAILDALRREDWSPRELRRKSRAAQESMQTLTMHLGRTPTESEVAADLKMPLRTYRELLSDLKALEVGSLNVERNTDTGNEELAYIPGPVEQEPLFRCVQAEMHATLVNALENLPERERLVLTLCYFEELTLKEIGLTLGVVESRVSQIRSSAILHLRATLGLAGRRRSPAKNLRCE